MSAKTILYVEDNEVKNDRPGNPRDSARMRVQLRTSRLDRADAGDGRCDRNLAGIDQFWLDRA